MVNVWWSSTSVVYDEVMKPGLPITAEIYSIQLDKMMLKLIEIQSRLLKKLASMLLQDNVRSHAVQMTLPKLLHHPPY